MAATSEQMRTYEQNASRMGVSREHLMEHAGSRAAELIHAKLKPTSRVAVFCGRGNKGGDGLVCARELSLKGHRVFAYLVGGGPQTQEAYAAFEKVRQSKTILQWVTAAGQVAEREFDCVVDALLGTGTKNEPLHEPIRGVVMLINQLPGLKVSLDIPTGVHPDTGEVLGASIVPNLTLTFHDKKTGLEKTRAPVGEVVVVDIGIPPEACA